MCTVCHYVLCHCFWLWNFGEMVWTSWTVLGFVTWWRLFWNHLYCWRHMVNVLDGSPIWMVYCVHTRFTWNISLYAYMVNGLCDYIHVTGGVQLPFGVVILRLWDYVALCQLFVDMATSFMGQCSYGTFEWCLVVARSMSMMITQTFNFSIAVARMV